MIPEAARWWLHGGGEHRTWVHGGFKPYSSLQWRSFQASPAGDPIIRSLSPSQSESGNVCSPTTAHWWTLVLPPTQQHSFMATFVSVSDYTLLPSLFFFFRLCKCLFPLMFLVNRSFLPPSCLYQLIYTITCLPALFSEGPAPSGIPISTSKEDWSGCF